MSCRQCDEFELKNMSLMFFLQEILKEAERPCETALVANSRLRLIAAYSKSAHKNEERKKI